MSHQTSLSSEEKKTALVIAIIYMARMLGLFLLLPIFSIAATQYEGATEYHIGLALGIYALSQAILQIPVGIISDKIGRKKVILIGLSFFFVGSLIAAFSTSIEVLIVARLIQGMGAVSAVCLAYIGDTVSINKQPKLMAVVGISIGLAFILALIIGPIVNKFFGLTGIFGLTAILALVAIISTTFLQADEKTSASRKSTTIPIKHYLISLAEKNLIPAYLRVFILHFLLSAAFYLIPHTVETFFTYGNTGLYLYLPASVIAFLFVSPLLKPEKKTNNLTSWMWLSIAFSLLSLASGIAQNTGLLFIPILALFFFGFTYIEAILPSSMLKYSNKTSRGAVSGIYTVCLFAGNFFGSLTGAELYLLDYVKFEHSLNLPIAYTILAALALTVFVFQTYFLKITDEEN